jgi:hypothetical protein
MELIKAKPGDDARSVFRWNLVHAVKWIIQRLDLGETDREYLQRRAIDKVLAIDDFYRANPPRPSTTEDYLGAAALYIAVQECNEAIQAVGKESYIADIVHMRSGTIRSHIRLLEELGFSDPNVGQEANLERPLEHENVELNEEEETFLDNEINTIEDSIPANLEGFDREALVKIRVGQSYFRARLLVYTPIKCKICGMDFEPLLIASHIKKWSESSRHEKVDISNGFLLCPQHDKLFDKGYISISDEGQILVSSQLDQGTRKLLALSDDIRIILSENNRYYLAWHRENIFQA